MKLTIQNKQAGRFVLPIKVNSDFCCEGQISVFPNETLSNAQIDVAYYTTDDKNLINLYPVSKKYPLVIDVVYFVIEYGGECIIDERCIEGNLILESECPIAEESIDLEICII